MEATLQFSGISLVDLATPAAEKAVTDAVAETLKLPSGAVTIISKVRGDDFRHRVSRTSHWVKHSCLLVPMWGVSRQPVTTRPYRYHDYS